MDLMILNCQSLESISALQTGLVLAVFRESILRSASSARHSFTPREPPSAIGSEIEIRK